MKTAIKEETKTGNRDFCSLLCKEAMQKENLSFIPLNVESQGIDIKQNARISVLRIVNRQIFLGKRL